MSELVTLRTNKESDLVSSHGRTIRARGDRQSSNLAGPVGEGADNCTGNLFKIENRMVSTVRLSFQWFMEGEKTRRVCARARALGRVPRGASSSRTLDTLLACLINAVSGLNRVVVACVALDRLIFSRDLGTCGSPYATLRDQIEQYQTLLEGSLSARRPPKLRAFMSCRPARADNKFHRLGSEHSVCSRCLVTV